ncbi:MAG: XRE family transcriptional regulator [Bdellovibrionales bacterium GWB1_52_6]|nr:MAG: XRE family transcriptional regulator [Bdellovibrionales bacterium GWB1_52_6]OFZ02735.1 MAG: XRE family transcriptional regulator [Bdellovibrionales bacterium GWA1_52_35]HCM41623.1 XRE family transcriptional regulator [Bdellovibrionales bacterium]
MADELTFGSVIAEARKGVGLSQKQLAERILREDGEPISPQYLNDIERDRRSPSSDHMVKEFAKALKLDADYLHYLNGRFPEPERRERMTPEQFEKAMVAFRKTETKSGGRR